MGDMEFDDFAASKPEAPTTQPMTDDKIINLVCTENDAIQEESDDDEEEEVPPAKLIKSTNKFLAIIDQQKAFLKRNSLPLDAVEQLEMLIVGNQISLCNKQKEVTDSKENGCVQNGGWCEPWSNYGRFFERQHIRDGHAWNQFD